MGLSVPQPVGVNQRSAAEAKIALFRSPFHGREDVYPRRFESWQTGRAGYAPACAHEWVPGICKKRRIKCYDCPHRRFLPVTDNVIRWHLSGRDDQGRGFVRGLYPIFWTRPVSCWPQILTRPRGRTTQPRSWRPVTKWSWRQLWSDLAQAMVDTFGSSSAKPYLYDLPMPTCGCNSTNSMEN